MRSLSLIFLIGRSAVMRCGCSSDNIASSGEPSVPEAGNANLKIGARWGCSLKTAPS